MSILTGHQIYQLLQSNPKIVEGYDPALISTASLDVRLGNTISVEINPRDTTPIRLADGQRVAFHTAQVDRFALRPGEFILCGTQERFNIPRNIHAEFTTTSTLARNGLEQMAAADLWPGFPGYLTLELKNMTRYHVLELQAGMVIGQIKFSLVEPVPEEESYEAVGRYGNKPAASPSIG